MFIVVVASRCFIAASIAIVVLSMTLLIIIQVFQFKVPTVVYLCMIEQQKQVQNLMKQYCSDQLLLSHSWYSCDLFGCCYWMEQVSSYLEMKKKIAMAAESCLLEVRDSVQYQAL